MHDVIVLVNGVHDVIHSVNDVYDVIDSVHDAHDAIVLVYDGVGCAGDTLQWRRIRMLHWDTRIVVGGAGTQGAAREHILLNHKRERVHVC